MTEQEVKAKTETWEVALKYGEAFFFHCEGDQAQGQVDQGDWKPPSLQIFKIHQRCVQSNQLCVSLLEHGGLV